ncbi:MAG: membrane dipeptidase [Desulfovibrionaceae bacterium]|nr:membrane dipeptidase [Desulfovibrionaceae bacterium]
MNDTARERAKALLGRIFVADAHFDLAPDLVFQHERGAQKVVEKQFLSDFRAGSVNLVVSSMFLESYFLPELGLRRSLDMVASVYREIRESSDHFRFCRSPEDARAARDSGQVAIALSFEGVEPLQGDLNLLPVFYELGVRGVGLAWSRRNPACDGAHFAPLEEGRPGGLTAFGIKLCRAAWDLGMWLDVSHLNDEGFSDLLAIADGPVMASHSNCRALASSMRNLTDDQIRALAAVDGLVCVNNIAPFIKDDWRERRLGPADLLDHVDHAVALVGARHVGLGFDLLDKFADYLNMDDAPKSYDALGSHAGLVDFTAGLIERGYADSDIELICGGNFMRLFAAAAVRKSA